MESLSAADPQVARLIAAEERLQRDCIRLIASENHVSAAVRAALGSVVGNRSSEGPPGRRCHEGQDHLDAIEELACARATALFGADHANVQPYSGSIANHAACLACVQPGDTVMGMELSAGGHLTHGAPASLSGRLYRPVRYGVHADSGRIDLDQVRELARRERPRLIFAGGTAVPRRIDFSAFAAIAREIDAVLVADIAHIAGLVAAGVHASPAAAADVISMTTHKTLRGPRGAILLSKAPLARAIDRAVFPLLQGAAHNPTTAAIAVALEEARRPAFVDYARQTVANAQRLADALAGRGFDIVSGGTDTHLVLCDLRGKQVSGKQAAQALGRAGILVNCNLVPFDPRPPRDPSGIRLGTAAVTSRGFGLAEMSWTAGRIDAVVARPDDTALAARIRAEVIDLCASGGR